MRLTWRDSLVAPRLRGGAPFAQIVAGEGLNADSQQRVAERKQDKAHAGLPH
jgi:hypothetical protein